MLFPAPSPTALGAISIVLADDHRMVRSALRALLSAHEGLEVVGDAGDAAQALAAVIEHRPAVLVLDLNMPGDLTALEAIPTIRVASPETGIVILTMQSDAGFARRTLALGATAYVLKDSADVELVDAVTHAAAGEAYITPKLAEAASAAHAGERTADLTPRELEVLHLIALGYTNPEIAARLVLSVRTVESHRAHIQKRLDRSSRAELVRYALDHHLLDA
jgi:two-component system response regulator NreC